MMDDDSSMQRRLAAILAADVAGYSRRQHVDGRGRRRGGG
jgi:hypothetical protein